MYYKIPKNLKVRAYIKNYDEIIKDKDLKIKDLQQRIDKAIEYIKESCVYDEDDGVEEKIYSLYVPTLLEILGDKENEET